MAIHNDIDESSRGRPICMWRINLNGYHLTISVKTASPIFYFPTAIIFNFIYIFYYHSWLLSRKLLSFEAYDRYPLFNDGVKGKNVNRKVIWTIWCMWLTRDSKSKRISYYEVQNLPILPPYNFFIINIWLKHDE